MILVQVVVQGTGAQCEAAADVGAGQECPATDLEVLRDRLVQQVQALVIAQPVRGHVPEAHGGQRSRRQQLHVRAGLDDLFHVPRQVDMPADVAHQALSARLLNVPEGFQRPGGIPRLLRAAVRVPDMAGEALPRRQAEIGGDELVGRLQQFALPHHGTATADGHRQPLVRIDGDGVGALHARETGREAGVERSQPAIGAVHVQPEALLATEIGETVEGVYGSGLHAPGVRRDEEGTVTGPAVSGDRRAQVTEVYPEIAVNSHLAGAAETEREGSLLQA